MATIAWNTFRTRLLFSDSERGVARFFPKAIWRFITPGLWCNLNGILDGAEAHARRLVQDQHPLSDLVSNEDLESGWGITPLTMLTVWRLLEEKRPQRIVEMGSGTSSLIFAHYASICRQRGEPIPRVVSLDHDEQWLEQTAQRLEQRKLREYVYLLHAPLRKQMVLGSARVTYAVSCLSEQLAGGGFDFCLIDGPPATVGRWACFPLISRFLAKRATVLLDDFARPTERYAVEDWSDAFRELAAVKCVLTSRGLAVLPWSRFRG